jgi:class 3 adenylate cyclase
MVSHYTKAVSSLVEKFGGSVVEFNGDGMVAVFGPPRSLADKERAAVAAGREIIQSMASVARSARETESAPPLSVGLILPRARPWWAVFKRWTGASGQLSATPRTGRPDFRA